MFESKTYQEKRHALNEILLQQMAGLVMMLCDKNPNAKMQFQLMLEQYGQGHQALRNGEANRVLGEPAKQEGVEYATSQDILDYLKANVGRTYFGSNEATSAPDGSIGTPGFHFKFKEWLNGCAPFDTVLNPEIVSGFYRDDVTQRDPLPLLLLRNGNELILVVFRQYVSVMVLNLDQIPENYNWNNYTHQALRGELFSYRGDLSIEVLEREFTAALERELQGLKLQIPERNVQTAGLAQIEEIHPAVVVSETSDESDTAEVKPRVSPCNTTKEQVGLGAVEQVGRGMAAPIFHVDEAGHFEKSDGPSDIVGLLEQSASEVNIASTYSDTSTPSAE